jgi:hypothetical protein
MAFLADLLAAVSTGTFGISTITFVRSWRRGVRAQARTISARVTEVTSPRPFTDLGLRTAGTGKSVHLRVHNGSSEPVYGFTPWIRRDYTPDSGMTGGPEPTQPLPPGDSDIWVDDVDLTDLAGFPHVDIEFRDAHGRCWWRDHGGRTYELRPGGRPRLRTGHRYRQLKAVAPRLALAPWRRKGRRQVVG